MLGCALTAGLFRGGPLGIDEVVQERRL